MWRAVEQEETRKWKASDEDMGERGNNLLGWFYKQDWELQSYSNHHYFEKT